MSEIRAWVLAAVYSTNLLQAGQHWFLQLLQVVHEHNDEGVRAQLAIFGVVDFLKHREPLPTKAECLEPRIHQAICLDQLCIVQCLDVVDGGGGEWGLVLGVGCGGGG